MTKRGRAISWVGASDPVRQAAALAGLSQLLGLQPSVE
jgi:hypothetical protein